MRSVLECSHCLVISITFLNKFSHSRCCSYILRATEIAILISDLLNNSHSQTTYYIWNRRVGGWCQRHQLQPKMRIDFSVAFFLICGITIHCTSGQKVECSKAQPCKNTTLQFCQLPIGLCGTSYDIGICVNIPFACPKIVRPVILAQIFLKKFQDLSLVISKLILQFPTKVCGCDGVSYSNECLAKVNKVSILYHGNCQQPVACMNQADCDASNMEPPLMCLQPKCGQKGTCVGKPQQSECPVSTQRACGCDSVI